MNSHRGADSSRLFNASRMAQTLHCSAAEVEARALEMPAARRQLNQMSDWTRYPPLAVAPMMDWTDRHCRYFHRLLAPSALVYTEMVTSGAVIHGDRDRLLGYNPEEHPIALQLGGSEPADLARPRCRIAVPARQIRNPLHRRASAAPG